MPIQWIIVLNKDHEYSIISSCNVASGNISCGSIVETTVGHQVVIIFIGSSKKQCEHFYRKLSVVPEAKLQRTSESMHTSSASDSSTQETGSHLMNVFGREGSSGPCNNSVTRNKRSIRVPRDMALELARTLSGLEEEIRSRFDHLDDIMEETSSKITSIENVLKLRQTSENHAISTSNGKLTPDLPHLQCSQGKHFGLNESTSVKLTNGLESFESG